MCRINFWREKERRIIIIIRNGANTISLQTLFGGTRKAQKIGIGWTNLAAVAIETKKGGFKFFLIPFIKLHETLAAIFGSKWPP
jgi:hypothetical protein